MFCKCDVAILQKLDNDIILFSMKVQIGTWLLPFGYSCSIGTITVKQWRVHCIFKSVPSIRYPLFFLCTIMYRIGSPMIFSHRNPYKKKSGIQDWHLILIVAALLLINIAFLCLHILLEGVINKFTLTTVLNKERAFRIEGVSGIACISALLGHQYFT